MCPSVARPAADLNLKISGGHKKGRRSAAWIGRLGWVGLARSAGEKYRVAPRRGREGSGGSGRLRLDGRRSKKYIFGAKGTTGGEEEEEALSRFSVEELAAAGQVSLSLPSCPDTYLKASLFCQNISHILDKAVVLLKCLCVAREPSLGNIHPRGR